MTDVDERLRQAVTPARELRSDPDLMPRLLRAGRTRRRRKASAAAAVLALGVAFAAYATVPWSGQSSRESIRFASVPVFPSPSPFVGRSAVIERNLPPSSGTVEATVVAEDTVTGQTVYRYDGDGRACLTMEARTVRAGAAGVPREGFRKSSHESCWSLSELDGVTFLGFGAVKDAAGKVDTPPLVYGMVPGSATTVVVEAKDGTSSRAQAIHSDSYTTNFYFIHVDLTVAGGPAAVVAYAADGREVGRWRPSA
jgi:hypothetical protein